ncbi:hypothetical protein Spla01_00140 [Streptomyces platensis]|uniref:Uncharacterized protein n=1 Tax=Streptomyces platensis TaxID=58346 RepID=A0ABX3Y5L9_STRPT|nr:hypothetical protein [Streptomyces platensis]OSY48308.1 hypothetical protein BG653_00185 [Streptomyces platensis]
MVVNVADNRFLGVNNPGLRRKEASFMSNEGRRGQLPEENGDEARMVSPQSRHREGSGTRGGIQNEPASRHDNASLPVDGMPPTAE